MFDVLPLPGIVSLKSITSSQGSCILLGGPVISCTLGSLNSGANAVVTIVVTPTAAGTIKNDAIASSSAVTTTGASDQENTSVEGVTNLSVSKVDFPDPARVGHPLTYTVVVTNGGPSASVVVTLTDILPASTNLGSVTPSQGSCSPGSTVTCTLGFLGTGGSATVTIVVTPTATGLITNTAVVTGGGQDPNLSNNVATQTTTVNPNVDLAITKTVASVAPSFGKVTTFTVAYSNTGTFTASNVVITDFLDSNVQYVTDTLGIAPVTTPTTVRWNLSDIGPGQGGSFDVGLQPVTCVGSSVSFTNAVRIESNIPEGGDTNNYDQAGPVTIPCGLVDLVVVKNDGVGTGDPITQVVAGGFVTYTISVNNVGDQTANNVVLTETLPANTSFVNPTGANGWFQVGTSNVYTYRVGTLSTGSGTVVYFVVQVASDLSCSVSQVVNTLQAGSDGPEADPTDNTVNEQTPVVCSAIGKLQLSKDDGVVCAIPGQLIDYTITVTNNDTAPATGLLLTEFLPANTSFQGPAGVWTPAGAGVFTHPLSTINPGQTSNTGFWAQVNPGISPSVTAITNQVRLDPGSLTYVLTTPIIYNAVDLHVVKNDNIELLSAETLQTIAQIEQKVGPAPWLEALKSGGLQAQATSVLPGDVISYSLAFGNAGTISATNVVITETLPANTTFLGPSYWTNVGGNMYIYTVTTLAPSTGGNLDFRVQVDSPFPAGVPGITNTVQISSDALSECDLSDNISKEFTPVGAGAGVTSTVYLPIILKNFPEAAPPTPTPTPTPLAYVSDVAADPDTNQIFVASPRHDWVYVINGSSDTIDRTVPVGHGPTGLTVLSATVVANNKVFVAHQYGANFWHPGVKAFGVNETASHDTSDTGYAGAAPVKIASNALNNNRVYVSNYFDKLAVIDGASGPPENRLGWVAQKAFQGAYGIDASFATNRVYLATRDTGELVVFDGNGDRLLQTDYIPTHVKPPQACSLWSVAVNETTGHVFVPCPQSGQVFVLQESQVSLLSLEALGVLEERDGYWALVVSPAVAPWITEINVPGGTSLGQEGIAADPTTGRVFITNAQNNTVVVLQDGATPSYVTTVAVGTQPQGVDVNPVTQKVYVGNAGSNTVTVLQATSPFSVVTTIPLTP